MLMVMAYVYLTECKILRKNFLSRKSNNFEGAKFTFVDALKNGCLCQLHSRFVTINPSLNIHPNKHQTCNRNIAEADYLLIDSI